MGLVQPNAAVLWWEHCKDMIVDVLNAKRVDVTAAIKRKFMSKFDLYDLRYKNVMS
jgi:hypothetical protein